MTAPAGWYPNPEGPGQRYWNGEQWLEPVSQPQVPQPRRSGSGTPTWVALLFILVVGIVVLIVHQVSSEQERQTQGAQTDPQSTQTESDENTVPGDGTFVVGTDIQPGTYRASAQPGCYWARLRSLDTSNVINNDNPDGPVVVEIRPSDKAFQTAGCAPFHRAG
jgi:cytoskeletal protein RodZ